MIELFIARITCGALRKADGLLECEKCVAVEVAPIRK